MMETDTGWKETSVVQMLNTVVLDLVTLLGAVLVG